MKNSLSLLTLSLMLLSFSACEKAPEHTEISLQGDESTTSVQGQYTGSLYEGNYVWAGAMNLAWNELSDSIIKEDIQLQSEDADVQEIVEKFNSRPFTTNDLDEESYYVKAGYGQETVDAINQESKAKFPDKSFEDLDLKLGEKDIISYAYFMKEERYVESFDGSTMKFNEERVKSFSGGNSTVRVVWYEDDDHFLIQLKLKETEEELFLAKGFDMKSSEEVVAFLREYDEKPTDYLEDVDTFKAPVLSLDYHRDYETLIGKSLANEEFEEYIIAAMFENIKFDMDKDGVRVENEAVIAMPMGAAFDENPPEPKHFILDKPYWVIMKRADSPNPYFLLGVQNTALMEVIE